MQRRGKSGIWSWSTVTSRVSGRREEKTLIQQRWSGWSLTETVAGGARGDTGEGPRGQEVTWRWWSSVNRRIKDSPEETDAVAKEALHAPTGDTSVHFLWNVSGIPGNQPTSTTSLARGTHPLTGNRSGSSAGKLRPSCLLQQLSQQSSRRASTSGGQITRKTR